ncbi:hypothetical protein CPA50_13845 [Marinobacter sp. ANT_B65]|nr:hypothetical protein CPA50_13845 [Marinobacter sp. ANT_B65]
MDESYTMEGSILCIFPSQLSSLIFVFLSLTLLGGKTLARPQLEGSLSETTYTSPSGRLNCTLAGIPIDSSAFFIDDSFTSEFEGVSFGYQSGESYLVWIVRLQKEGRKDVSPATLDGFPVSSNGYIPYFYSGLPYEISELSQKALSDPGGSTGLLKVQFGSARQVHGYWVRPIEGWLQSVQFLPGLTSMPNGILDEGEVRLGLNRMVKQCGFTLGK